MKIKIKKQSIFDIYIFIFIFTMINREFVLFGLDLRYVQIFLSLLIIVGWVSNYQRNLKVIGKLSRLEKNILWFYVIIFLSNVFFVRGRTFQITTNELLNLNILHLNNFLCIIVFFFYKKSIVVEKICRYIKISSVVLFLSCVLVFLGIPIPKMFATGARTSSIDTNLFGGNIRIAGFGEDANYTFLFFYTCLLICTFFYKKKRDYMLIFMCLSGMAFAFSKTQMIMMIPSFLIYWVLVKLKMNIKQKNVIMFLLVLTITMIPMILSKIELFGSLTTMSTRYKLWNICFQMLEENYYLPSGLGACRFYINSYFRNAWLVQSHSTYVAMICEWGIISVVLWITIFWRLLTNSKNVSFIAILNFLFFSITSETIHLQYFVFIVYLVFFLGEKKKKEESE